MCILFAVVELTVCSITNFTDEFCGALVLWRAVLWRSAVAP